MFLTILTPLLLFIAWLLLLLVSLSVPIVKSIFLFKLTAHLTTSSILHTSANALVHFGVWGFCVSDINASIVGIKESERATCSKPHLGYDVSTPLVNDLHLKNIDHIISRTSVAALVLNPIACGLTFVALLFSLVTLLRSRRNGVSRVGSTLTFMSEIVAGAVTTIVFIINIAVVAIIRHEIHKVSDGILTLNWGNAVWMTLGAMIAIMLSSFGSFAGIFRMRRQRRSAQGTY